MKIYFLYDTRQGKNKQKRLEDEGCTKVVSCWLMKYGGIVTLRSLITTPPDIDDIHYSPESLFHYSSLAVALKEDVSESMKMHKELYGQPHPRWDEVSQM